MAHRRSRMRRLALAGAASMSAVAVGLTPIAANAASSETYFVGFPDWLPIGEGSVLPSDAVAINNAIVAAKDKNPLIGWGTGGADLRPVWVRWVDGVPEYTVPEVGQTGSHTETYQDVNPLYQPAYDTAYNAAYAAHFAAETVKALSWNCGRSCAENKARPIAQQKATQDAQNAVKDIPKMIDISITVPEYGIVEDGYWTTVTAGQWVTGTDIDDLPTAGQLAYAAYVLQNGDMSALAPLLNWTAYLSNVNLIAYGDGAIAAGQAYQAFIDSVNGQTHEGYDPYTVGGALTGPRKIVFVDAQGQVTLITVQETNDPTDLPDIVYPGSGQPPAYESAQGGGVLDMTVLSLVLLRNPGRANGGLYARFAPIYQELTGVNPVSPDRQDVLPEGVDPALLTNLLKGDTSNLSLDELGNLQAVLENADGKPIVVTLKADVGWQYDLLSDAPANANPIAWANSVASALMLTNLLTGVDLDDLGDGGHVGPDGTIYYTIPVNQLPLLAPLRLPAQLLGTLQNQDPNSINTPIADALEPMLKILVNSAYTDVVRNEDGTWTRTLDQAGVPTLFGTPTLTREQAAYLAGDLITALGRGVGTELNEVLPVAAAELAKALNIELTAVQKEELNQALAAVGTSITERAKEIGDGVTKYVREIDAQLPALPPPPTQAQIADVQKQVGKALVEARDAAHELRDRLEDPRALLPSFDDSGVKPGAAEKAKLKESLQKVRAELKKAGDEAKKRAEQAGDDAKKRVEKAGAKVKAAVDKAGEKVRKALTPPKKAPQNDTE